jgi:hypothetical protein
MGAFNIKVWNDNIFCCVTIAKGSDFEIDRWDIDDDIMERKIVYMYAVDGVMNFEVE